MATAAKRRAISKYNKKHYRSVSIRWPVEFVENLGEAARQSGSVSLASYVREAIEQRMEREGYTIKHIVKEEQ